MEKEDRAVERLQTQAQAKKTLKITTDDRRKEAFSRIKKDCKSIPFWIPEPFQFKDFDPQRIVREFDQCKSIDETLSLIKKNKADHYRTFEREYRRHRELLESTLNESYREWEDGVLPCGNNQFFIKPRCCFNHYFGLTSKRGDNNLLPVFDYELHLVYNLDTRNLINLIASRGLGKTHTIVVRYSNWRVLRSTEWDNQDIALTTGLAQINATELLLKIEKMYLEAFPFLDLDRTGNELFIDKTRYIAFPTENIKRMRLYDKMAAVIVDEADFYSLLNQDRLLEAGMGYVLKSTPLIVFFSTPDKPNGYLIRSRKRWLAKLEEMKRRGK